MEQSYTASLSCKRATLACGIMVVLVGLATLLGWATNDPVLLGFRANYIPMAPNTALAMLALGSGLIALADGRVVARGIAAVAAVFVGLGGLIRLSEYLGVAGVDVDQWFVHVHGGRFGLAPLGKMALPTATTFVSASLAITTLAWPSRVRAAGHAAGVCGVATTMSGLVFSLGYMFSPNAPLLYGSDSIPMALNTALCFVALGVGIATAAGPLAFPLVRLAGPSIRARLLRTFLPLVMVTVGIVAWFTHLVTKGVGASSAAISSSALAALAIVVFGWMCERIAGRVGGQIERAEAELQEAHDLLEVKVQERTAELSRANGELAEALRETSLAHASLQQAHAELKQTQSRMFQQARLASLGQTAAGVAHEINNPLAFITNNMAVLKREVRGMQDIIMLYQQAARTLEEYQRELYTKISDLAEEVDLPYVLENLNSLIERSGVGLVRIQKIVADLRDFAHLEEADFKEADLNAGIATTVRLMQDLADRRQVKIELKLTDLPQTTCYPAKLNLMVQSLISNAIDACDNGGHVIVSSHTVTDGIAITVADDGCGIDPQVCDRVFDPFFTTKPIGRGTGLGLAISYGIVKDHGVTIDFESTPGEGTTFFVRLPVVSLAPGVPAGLSR